MFDGIGGKKKSQLNLHYGGEGVLVRPSYQGVCMRHGMEDDVVTRGDLAFVVITLAIWVAFSRFLPKPFL